MDWPDTLFTEAFADVPSWSVHEPAWQRRYLGAEVAEAVSLRALFSDVMLDVAWSLFEMRMLLRELWPAGLHPKISEFTTSQLIALRFASDAELPELAQTVLRDGITNQKQIKLMIKNWKADHQRV